jgi:hypothetical protein
MAQHPDPPTSLQLLKQLRAAPSKQIIFFELALEPMLKVMRTQSHLSIN